MAVIASGKPGLDADKCGDEQKCRQIRMSTTSAQLETRLRLETCRWLASFEAIIIFVRTGANSHPVPYSLSIFNITFMTLLQKGYLAAEGTAFLNFFLFFSLCALWQNWILQ